MIDSIVKYVLGKVRIIGNTDGTLVGNDSDRLKVAALVTRSDASSVTYSVGVAFVAPTLATDIFTITGSASKTVQVIHMSLCLTATTGSNATVNLIRRSTANTAGTSTTPTIAKWDSASAAATAVVRAYTANPTLGTTAGTLMTDSIYVSGGGTVGSDPLEYSYDLLGGSPITLRGTSEVLAINLNGVTFAGNSCRATVIWVEV